eukprot:748457-Hanusia_phi.AAC.5
MLDIARFLLEMRTASLLLALSSQRPSKPRKLHAARHGKTMAKVALQEHPSSDRSRVALLEEMRLQDLVQENSMLEGSSLRLTCSGVSYHAKVVEGGRGLEVGGGAIQACENFDNLVHDVFHLEMPTEIALTMLEYKNTSSDDWEKLLDIPKVRNSLSAHHYDLLLQSAQSWQIETGGFRSYKDAANFVRSLELKDQRQVSSPPGMSLSIYLVLQWTCWAESPARPADIPTRPWEVTGLSQRMIMTSRAQVYQDNWVSLREFLGAKRDREAEKGRVG